MRRIGILIIIIASLALGRDVCAQKPQDVSESYAKAVALYNFPKLVEWPATVFPNADSPIAICVLGDDSFAAELEQAVDGKKATTRKLAVKRLKWNKDPKELKECTMLYIAAAEAAHGDDI